MWAVRDVPVSVDTTLALQTGVAEKIPVAIVTAHLFDEMFPTLEIHVPPWLMIEEEDEQLIRVRVNTSAPVVFGVVTLLAMIGAGRT